MGERTSQPRERYPRSKQIESTDKDRRRIYIVDKKGVGVRIIGETLKKGEFTSYKGIMNDLPRVGETLRSREGTVKLKVVDIQHFNRNRRDKPDWSFIVVDA